jgi:hypothetical protein
VGGPVQVIQGSDRPKDPIPINDELHAVIEERLDERLIKELRKKIIKNINDKRRSISAT